MLQQHHRLTRVEFWALVHATTTELARASGSPEGLICIPVSYSMHEAKRRERVWYSLLKGCLRWAREQAATLYEC